MTTIRVALVQCNANMPKAEAIDKHVELIGKAAAEGAQVTCLQEIFHGPYFPAERCLAKLRQLEALGVHQFNIYSMVDDPSGVIEGFGRHLIPAFA